MRHPRILGSFKRDVRKLERRGCDMDKLKVLIRLLLQDAPLPAKYGDHPLKGDWNGWRDAHIEPDWVLIYKTKGDELLLARTGTHTDVFGW